MSPNTDPHGLRTTWLRNFLMDAQLRKNHPLKNKKGPTKTAAPVYEPDAALCLAGNLLALGIGSLFNHSSRPNVDYRVHEETLTIDYFAARDVPAGEELCIYYGPDEELWFDVK